MTSLTRIRSFWTGSLRRQLVVGIALVHAFLMSVFVIDMVHRQRDFQNEEYRQNALSIARTLAINSESWVLARDLSGLEEVLLAQNARSGLLYAMIISPRGRVLAHTEQAQVGQYLGDGISQQVLNVGAEEITLHESDHQVDLAVPIDANGRLVGWARVGLSKEAMQAGLAQITLNGLVYTLVAIVIGTVFALIMSRSMTRRLCTVAGLARQIGDGRLELRLPRAGKDEITELSVAINDMAAAMEKRRTKERRLKADLEQHREVLEAAVRKRTQELEAEVEKHEETQQQLLLSKTEAESANATKSQFLANMSHEVRTPLNGVMGMLQLLQRMETGQPQKQYIELALESSHHLVGVISDILDLSKVEAGKLSLSKEPVEIRKLTDQVQRLFKVAARDKGLALSVSVAPGVPEWIVSDFSRLRQIMSNLVGNAIKFTAEGGARVEVNVIPEGTGRGPMLEIIVRDSGIGIATTELDAVRQPFVQADSSPTREYDGSGLGLAIVDRLLELMGGVLELDSEEGQGTVATVRIPLEVPDQEADEGQVPDTGGEVRASAHERILLADDAMESRAPTEEYLSLMGYDVTIAQTGAEVLERLGEAAFDIVLMDVRMPEMDGIEATRRIRAGEVGEEKAQVVIIALTAHAMAEDRERFLAAGMTDYVSKPIDFDELSGVLERYRAVGTV